MECRTRAWIVAVFTLILSVVSLTAMSVWVCITLRHTPDLSSYLSTIEGKEFIWISVSVLVGSSLESSLAVLLLIGITKDSFGKVQMWFLVQNLFLAAITWAFLFDLASPRLPVIPFFAVVIVKSICVWIVSQFVDEMKAASERRRLLSP